MDQGIYAHNRYEIWTGWRYDIEKRRCAQSNPKRATELKVRLNQMNHINTITLQKKIGIWSRESNHWKKGFTNGKKLKVRDGEGQNRVG